MAHEFQVKRLKASLPVPDSSICYQKDKVFKIGFLMRAPSPKHKLRFKIVAKNLGDRWKLNNIDANAVQERLSSWMSKTQNLLNEVALPLIKTSQTGRLDPGDGDDSQDMEELFMTEQTIQSNMPAGMLSLAAIISIEQFSRMDGLTGQKMQEIFKTIVPEALYRDARFLVEYCCFRFLSRDSSDVHPSLKEPAFQRLIFITMLAWENPYCNEGDACNDASENPSFQGKLVGEEAFVRIAPAVSGVADRSTVHSLFKVLASTDDEHGISLAVWLTYIRELLKVHEGRKSYQIRECPELLSEKILCLASSRKHPVLKWENNIAWPGNLTLTDKALYFQPVGLVRGKKVMRFDLTRHELSVEKAKVGPLGSALFDSAVSVSSGPRLDTWVLEFVDLGGELRRDAWHASISEVIALHTFLHEYGPEDDNASLFHVFGAKKGKEKAIASASSCIARLQALQFMRKLPDDPIKLVQFSYLQTAPYGNIVCQTLAVNFWGGPLVTEVREAAYKQHQAARPAEASLESINHATDIDGSIYLKKWMKSSSWASSASINFWKNSSLRKGIVLSKNLAVADLTLVERAAETCRQKCGVVEKTQATIDAATIKGIPSNIDLFKELMLPFTVTTKNFEKLRRWEEPQLTVSFLACAYTMIFRNLLPYVFPVTLIILAAGMLTVKGLREQGRLGRSFGKVTIRDQPPSNTIQKIIAVKDAMHDVETYLQNMNVVLLKLRTIVLSGHPQITTEVALVLLSFATVLLVVPFKYVLAFLLFDLFTRELEFRREMVRRFIAFLKEQWETVPAASVVVLPYESDEPSSSNQGQAEDDKATTRR